MRSVRRSTWVALVAWALVGCAHRPAGSGERRETATPSAQQLLEIADLLEERNEPLRAQQYLRLAQREGVPASQVVPRLLRVYVADRQYRLAIDEAERYLRRHPSDERVRRLLATLYAGTGQPGEAVGQFERALEEAPTDPDLHFALATTLYDAGRERLRADTHFRRYLALAPDGPHSEEARSLLLKEVVP